jgi:acetyl-CoA C-acetyltransferase
MVSPERISAMSAQTDRARAWVLTGSRTPIGSFKKSLRDIPVEKLAEVAMRSALRKANIPLEEYDGVMLGHGYQSSMAPNTARCASLAAGVPASVPAMTLQRQCGSGMEAVNAAMKEIFLGNGNIYLDGSMSGVPYLLPANLRYRGPIASTGKFPFGPRPVAVALADDGLVPRQLLWDPKTTHMGYTAQRLADAYEISREDADKYALRSHQLAVQASKSGRFKVEIEPVDVSSRGLFRVDEHPRDGTSLEKLGTLRPSLKTRDITAGNSSGINDGACSLVLVSGAHLEKSGLEPLVELVDSCVIGLDPEQMGLGPVLAIRKLLARNNLQLSDIDLFEINEAFAAQYVACEKLLKLDREKVNVNGGAIALGHPIGMSGARLILTLAHELKQRKLRRGIASLCIGGGMGIATLLEVH